MTDDLLRIGAALDVATGRAVQRRRARAHAMRSALASAALAIPFALAAAPGQLAPAAGPLPHVPRLVDAAVLPPTVAFMVRHIPDENASSVVELPCLDGIDCRTTRSPSAPQAGSAREGMK